MSKRITESDLCRSARRVGCSTAEIETFLEVETKGKGFDSQGRPLILFERHWFHKLTKGRFDATHPHISNKTPGGYGPSAAQYDRFSEAFALDPQAAMKSASWGLGQVMGFNHEIAGYSTVDDFVDAMKISEGKQLDAAIEFIIHNDLDDELRRHDWAGFARGYNGAAYKKNKYDTKLAAAYDKFKSRKINCDQISTAAPDKPATETPGNSASSDIPPAPANDPPSITETKTTEVVQTENTTVAVEHSQTMPKGDTPDVPPTKVSKNGALSNWLFGSGALTTFGTAIWGFVSGHLDAVAIGIICLTLLIIVIIFRGAITDAIRMHTAADVDKKNVS